MDSRLLLTMLSAAVLGLYNSAKETPKPLVEVTPIEHVVVQEEPAPTVPDFKGPVQLVAYDKAPDLSADFTEIKGLVNQVQDGNTALLNETKKLSSLMNEAISVIRKDVESRREEAAEKTEDTPAVTSNVESKTTTLPDAATSSSYKGGSNGSTGGGSTGKGVANRYSTASNGSTGGSTYSTTSYGSTGSKPLYSTTSYGSTGGNVVASEAYYPTTQLLYETPMTTNAYAAPMVSVNPPQTLYRRSLFGRTYSTPATTVVGRTYIDAKGCTVDSLTGTVLSCPNSPR